MRRFLPSFPALLLTTILASVLFVPMTGAGPRAEGPGAATWADATDSTGGVVPADQALRTARGHGTEPNDRDGPHSADAQHAGDGGSTGQPGQQGQGHQAADTGHAHHAGHRARAPDASEASEHSVYQLPGTWTDQNGRSLELAHLAGRPQVVAMVYTHCTFACPRILAQMKQIEQAVTDDAGFVLVSIDPERDTPDRLADFSESLRLDDARWTLLNGSDGDILALSVLLGVKYRATGQGDFAHSNLITVLDGEGRIVERVEGLGADVQPAIRALKSLEE